MDNYRDLTKITIFKDGYSELSGYVYSAAGYLEIVCAMKDFRPTVPTQEEIDTFNSLERRFAKGKGRRHEYLEEEEEEEDQDDHVLLPEPRGRPKSLRKGSAYSREFPCYLLWFYIRLKRIYEETEKNLK